MLVLQLMTSEDWNSLLFSSLDHWISALGTNIGGLFALYFVIGIIFGTCILLCVHVCVCVRACVYNLCLILLELNVYGYIPKYLMLCLTLSLPSKYCMFD